ncbi:DUF2262 domain-containing protein [Puniceicoccus vermicola]|uniref:DUF2262 domain-containing protein n=1 Tax=Puniceicoccus vermicola TaxID=388746 RepID=A0A7X1E5I0_9BACT|nr:DUF2262 domain-containing protein [Puniceicoccus vermicola]MBC2601627.1 DUF2262 domain-containing protein [Puniceicoccus vermicola]
MEDIFEKARRRQQQIYASLNEQPTESFLGLVEASGPGASKSKGEKDWTVSIGLVAWKDSKGILQKNGMTLRKIVPEEKTGELTKKIEPYAIVSFKAKVADFEGFDKKQALLINLENANAQDDELNEIAENLKQPVCHKVPHLGTFTLDRSVNWYEGKKRYGLRHVSIYLDTSEGEEFSELAKQAQEIWKKIKKLDQDARDCAVSELLETKNGFWLNDGDSEISEKAFRKQMTLDYLNLDSNGSVEFAYNDGDLFWGHTIVVRGNHDTGFTDAGIEG